MELSWEAPRVLLTAQAQQGTARAQAACKALCLEEQARCLLTAQGLQGWGLICKYSRVGVGFFVVFFLIFWSLLVLFQSWLAQPIWDTLHINCLQGWHHQSSTLFTKRIICFNLREIIAGLYSCWWGFIFTFTASKIHVPFIFFLSHLHKCERKQKNQCVYTHECLQIMFWDLSSLQTILQISQHLYNISRRSSIIGKN